MTYSKISDLKRSLEAGRVNASAFIESCISDGKEFRIHPLGFIACTLMIEKQFKARLHIWPIGLHEQDAECTIHDHIFEFTSWVLVGVVENIEYPDFKAGNERFAYSTTYSGEKSILTKTNISLQLGEPVRKTIKQGGSYEVEAGRLHETRLASKSGAITILITRDTGKVSPMVVGSVQGEYQYEFERRAIGVDELRGYLHGMY